MHPNLFGHPLRPPCPAGILEVADELLLLRIHRDHRLLCGECFGHTLVDMQELRVPVRMIAALPGFAVGLQAEVLLCQQFANHGAADRMALCSQFRRKSPQALAGPAQCRHRIAPLRRLNQRQQRGQQSGVRCHQWLAAATRATKPSGCNANILRLLLQSAPDPRLRGDAGSYSGNT